MPIAAQKKEGGAQEESTFFLFPLVSVCVWRDTFFQVCWCGRVSVAARHSPLGHVLFVRNFNLNRAPSLSRHSVQENSSLHTLLPNSQSYSCTRSLMRTPEWPKIPAQSLQGRPWATPSLSFPNSAKTKVIPGCLHSLPALLARNCSKNYDLSQGSSPVSITGGAFWRATALAAAHPAAAAAL